MVRAHAKRVKITTTAQTTILSFTAPKTGLYSVSVAVAVLTASTTLTAQATWTDPDGGAATYTFANAVNEAVGVYTFGQRTACVKGGTVVNLNITAGTANQIIASGLIEEKA